MALFYFVQYWPLKNIYVFICVVFHQGYTKLALVFGFYLKNF